MIERYLPLSAIHSDPGNSREHSPRNLEIIEHSLRAYGQYRPFVVRQCDMRIAIGNGMYLAMLAMGWNIPVRVRILELSDEEFRILSIGDNRSSDLSSNDEELLFEQLDRLNPELRFLAGFNESEFKEIMEIPEPVFRDEAFIITTPADTLFNLGEGIFIRVKRADFDHWHDEIRAVAGLNESDIIDEIKRRLQIV